VEPRPSYIVALNRADLLIETGMDLEIGWLPALVRQTRNGQIRLGGAGRVVASKGIRPLEVPVGRVDRSMGDIHPEGNPHYLVDPERAVIAARNIARGMSAVAPEHREQFAANAAAFERRVGKKMAELRQRCARCRGCKVLTFHQSWSYFAERFGLEVVNTIEPKPGISPSPAHIARLIDQVKHENVKLVLAEPWHRRSIPRALLEETGARLVVMPVHPAQRDGGDYLATAEKMVAALVEAME
jgi:ABC-type Zn uptake system ZnuABC Zn-binding protein ZnuA